MKKEKKMIENYETTRVPKNKQLQGVLASLAILVGFTFFTPSMSAGGQLGLGLSLQDFTIALLCGNSFLAIYCGVLAYIGQKTGKTMDQLAIQSFGTLGSYLPSILISITQIGWFGVGIAMFAIPVSQYLGISQWLVIALSGLLIMYTASKGIKSITKINAIVVVLMGVLGMYSIFWGLNRGGGITALFDGNITRELSLSAGISIVIGSFVSGGTATPNFMRFSKTTKIAVFATVVAFFLGNSFMMIVGAIGATSTGNAGIFEILMAQGLTLPAIITLGINIWSANNNAVYTAGLGASNITKKPLKPLIFVSGAIGTLLSLWLFHNFVEYLSILGGIIPPVGIVIILHYALYKDEYELDTKKARVHIGSVLAVVIGGIVGFFLPIGINSINAITATAIVFLAQTFYSKSKVKEKTHVS